MAGDGIDRPPKVRFTLAVGVTGHRRDALPPAALAALPARIEAILRDFAAAAGGLHAEHGAVYAAAPPVLRLVTALADGSDQIAAEAGLAAGYELQAVLPFGEAGYGASMPNGAGSVFHGLLARAACALELPGREGAPLDAFVMAGRATIAHCDVLLAIWDGLPARGRGGTGEVVELALRRGTPVIHVAVDGQPLRLLWSGFDGFILHPRSEDIPARPFDAEAAAALLSALLAPPEDPGERACLDAYYREPQRRFRARVEYPLLLACTGARPLRPGNLRVVPFADAARDDWFRFRSAVDDPGHGVSAPLDAMETAFGWSDGLAQHFAQTYRSGHVFNFVLAAAAVLLGLSGLLMRDLKLWLAIAELLAVVAFVVNTRVGTDQAWQRRWLDYRQLAERLRPMRSLKQLGIAEPDQRLPAGIHGRRWVDWYAARMWRSDGCASGIIADDGARALAALIVAEELQPQIDYHRTNAHQIRHLDHRLHQAGTILFIASILSSMGFIALYFADHEWVAAHALGFVFISAGLPALGTAVFGIRVQGDFGGTAERSLATAARLERIAAAIGGGVGLSRAADLVEAAARAMVDDLAEWRLSHQQRRLEIPG